MESKPKKTLTAMGTLRLSLSSLGTPSGLILAQMKLHCSIRQSLMVQMEKTEKMCRAVRTSTTGISAKKLPSTSMKSTSAF